MEPDPALRGFCFKIWRCVSDLHLFFLLFLFAGGYFKFDSESQYRAREINSQNLFRSMLPPETIATIGPLPAFPLRAAARGRAPAPSEMTRAFSAMRRIAFFVSSRVTTR